MAKTYRKSIVANVDRIDRKLKYKGEYKRPQKKQVRY